MKKTIITSLIGLVFATPAYSAENIALDDVVVTATRTPQPHENVIADVTVINAEEIQRAGQTTLVELLQLQPGVEVSNTGGAGKVSGIFMRGTNSDHIVVLIDGMRVNSATTGTTAFENLPLNQIDRIEILRGPATSLYGQDAIGGVIQLFTKKGKGELKVWASAGYGTYDTSIGEAGIRGSINDTSYAFSISASNTNSFSALDSNNPNINDNDGYRNLSFSGNLSQKLAEDHEMGVQFLNSNGTTRFDNSSNTSDFSSKAKINQQSVALFSKNQWTSFWLSNFRVGVSKDKLKNYDEIGFFNPINPTIFNTEQIQISWQNDFNLPVGSLTLMYDRLEEDVESTTDFEETNRINDGYVMSYLANIGAHSIHLSYRNDHNSKYGNNQTGGIGYGFSFNDNWRATASYGNAFKAPTFNDLFFPSFNNPDLAPEKSDNVEISLRYQDTDTSLSATIFDNHIRNLIAFDSTTFTIENLEKTRIKGLTLAGSQHFGNFNIQASADIQSPRDEDSKNLLPLRANRHGKLNLSYSWKKWRWGAEILSSSARYNDKANSKRLNGYSIFNLTASYKVNNDWTVQARANNVFDKNYILAYDFNDIAYNTPGSNLFVNIRYQPE